MKFGKLPSEIKSYRCVTQQDSTLANFDKILYVKLNSICVNNNILIPDQYGFIIGSSCEHQLVDLLDIIYSGMGQKFKYISIVFTDLTDAFNAVPIDKLIDKLILYGIGGDLLIMIKEILINRKQCVNFNGCKSSCYEVTSGVPQGGHLSPLLFNLFINDISLHVNYSKIFRFADDICIVKGVNSETCVANIQSDINNINEFCQTSGLKINSEKCKNLNSSLKPVQPFNQLNIDREPISIVEEHKHLGVVLDKKLSFKNQLNAIIQKFNVKFYFFKRNFKKLGAKYHLQLYKTYILPIIEYSSLVWFGRKSILTTIEKLQKKGDKIFMDKIRVCI